MPVCDICSQELISDSELKTHLLLNHLDNKMACPLCSLSGVSYDELDFHISTAHAERSANRLAAPSDPTSSDKRRVPDLPAVSASWSPTVEGLKKPNRSAALLSNWGQDITRHHRSKQKRLSSPGKERKFSCPICGLVCPDCFVLQEHVELHLQDQSLNAGSAEQFLCPICAVVCEDGGSLQKHVELHLDSGTADSAEDLRLAQRLQKEEERKRKEEEVRREAEDFKQLQKQFGMDNGGGYRRQMERNLERAVSRGEMTPSEFHSKRVEMMERLASGLDDGRTRTTGLMSALYGHYQREIRDGTQVWLCSDSDHFSSSEGDQGWGCGYRNLQMLLSCLQRLEAYRTLNTLPDSLPSIPRMQALIEAAWAEGIDPQGASQFNGRLKSTRAWIGATEIYAMLTFLRLRARIVDFHQPTGPGNTHPRLFEWVKNYFSLPFSRSARVPPGVVKTNLPPIYLQHQGHSRSIIGLEERRNGTTCVLMFDPSCSPAEMRKLLSPCSNSASFNRMRKFPSHLKHRQYQLVVVEGALSEQEKQERVVKSRTFHAERIP